MQDGTRALLAEDLRVERLAQRADRRPLGGAQGDDPLVVELQHVQVRGGRREDAHQRAEQLRVEHGARRHVEIERRLHVAEHAHRLADGDVDDHDGEDVGARRAGHEHAEEHLR